MEIAKFDEELPPSQPTLTERSVSGLTDLVQKWGLARDTESAQKLLLIIAGIAVLIALVSPFMFGGSGNEGMVAPPGYEIVTPPGLPPRLQEI